MDSRLLADAPADMGEQYERGMVPILFAPWADVLIARVQPQPGERVLDVACGTGVVTRLVAERVGPSGTFVGADVSPSMLAAAQRASEGLPIEWREADAAALPFADGSFDLVLCQQGLQFFPDRVAGLREMRRVLIPGGRLGVAVWGSQEENAAFAALGRLLAKHFGPQAGILPPNVLGDPALARDLVAEAGFREIEARQETLPVCWPSPVEFLNRLAVSAGPMIAALTAMSAEARSALVDEFAASLADYTTDAGLIYTSASNLIIARA